MVEHVDEEVGGLPRDASGASPEHVLPVTGGLDDHAEFAHPFADRGGLRGRGFQRRTVANQFHAMYRPLPCTVPMMGCRVANSPMRGLEVVADGQRGLHGLRVPGGSKRSGRPHDTGLPPADEKK